MNNKKLVLYEPATSVGADPLTASDFTVLVLIVEPVIKFIPVSIS
jgi:hypothetical protein